MGERERGHEARALWDRALSRLIVPGGVYGGDGAIFAEENPIFQSKNRFLAVSAPENPQDFSGNW